MPVILVTGSRSFTDYPLLSATLSSTWDALACRGPALPLILIEGEARGADLGARRWWEQQASSKQEYGMTLIPIPADWDTHHPSVCSGACPGSRRRDRAPYCSMAGFRRNQMMVDVAAAFGRTGHEVAVMAFRVKGKSPGTDDCICRAEAAGLSVEVITPS